MKNESTAAQTNLEKLEAELSQERQVHEDKLNASVEKFNKITTIYSQLREDHLKVLRAVGC